MDKFTIKEQATEITVMRDVFRGPAGPQGERGQKGEQGDPGQDGTVSFDELTPEQRESLVGPKGDKGDTGEQGIAGEDGVSPTVAIDNIEGGHALTITDRDHPGGQTIEIMDGADGDTGPVGPGVPAGGTDGDMLVKNGAADYTARWEKPQYSRPNLLDNWYFVGGGSQLGYGVFPINQRGQNSYSNADWSIDRWKLVSGSLQVTAAGLILNGTITQKLGSAVSQPVTASVLTADGLVAGQYDASTQTFSISSDGSAAIIAAKLELGSYQTLAHNEGTEENPDWVLNELPDYGEELAKCQRYLLVMNPKSETWHSFAIGYGFSASRAYILLFTPASMIAMPEVSYTGVPMLQNGPSASRRDVSSINAYSLEPNSVMLDVTTDESNQLTPGALYTLGFRNTNVGKIILSAGS